MANSSDHAVGAFVAVFAAHAAHEANTKGEVSAAPLLSGSVGAMLGSLPDILEPAIHPHHRQFFHSVAFGALVVWGALKLYRWKPQEPLHQFLRGLGLVAGIAYAAHLLMDAGTPRSIPLVSLR